MPQLFSVPRYMGYLMVHTHMVKVEEGFPSLEFSRGDWLVKQEGFFHLKPQKHMLHQLYLFLPNKTRVDVRIIPSRLNDIPSPLSCLHSPISVHMLLFFLMIIVC